MFMLLNLIYISILIIIRIYEFYAYLKFPPKIKIPQVGKLLYLSRYK